MRNYFRDLSQYQKSLLRYVIMISVLIVISLLILTTVNKQKSIENKIAALNKQTKEMQFMAKAMLANSQNSQIISRNKLTVMDLMQNILDEKQLTETDKLISKPMNELDSKKLFTDILLNTKEGKTEIVSDKNGFILSHYLQ